MKLRSISPICEAFFTCLNRKFYPASSLFLFVLLLTLFVTVNGTVVLRGQVQGQSKSNSIDSQNRSSITGRVSADGRAVPGIEVRVSNDAGLQFHGITDENGEFSVNNIPVGAYRVFWICPGYVADDAMLNSDGSFKYYRTGDRVLANMVKGGVITGKVTDAEGEPVIGVGVDAIELRDSEGRQGRAWPYGDQVTDDRGVYRIYGLPSGTYIVRAASNQYNQYPSPFEHDVPTYYPSETLDTAKEVDVTTGSEASGIDISYRGGPGHVVSGRITGTVSSSNTGFFVSLLDSKTKSIAASALLMPVEGETRFSLQRVADGDYDLVVQGNIGDNPAVSDIQHITVKGSDVTGLTLQLNRLGVVAGTFKLESPTSGQCKDDKKNSLGETAIYAQLLDQNLESDFILSMFTNGRDTSAADNGSFSLKGLATGRYHLNIDLPNDRWFVKGITLSGNASDAVKKSILHGDVVTLKRGQLVDGVTIGLFSGGAVIRGNITPALETKTAFDGLKVYLMPTDSRSMNDVFQYFTTSVQNDGSFVLKNIKPCKYFVLLRQDTRDKTSSINKAMDDSDRAKLYADAQSKNSVVEIQPCQQMNDFVITYPQIPKSASTDKIP